MIWSTWKMVLFSTWEVCTYITLLLSFFPFLSFCFSSFSPLLFLTYTFRQFVGFVARPFQRQSSRSSWDYWHLCFFWYSWYDEKREGGREDKERRLINKCNTNESNIGLYLVLMTNTTVRMIAIVLLASTCWVVLFNPLTKKIDFNILRLTPALLSTLLGMAFGVVS